MNTIPTITPNINPASPSFSGFKPLSSNFTNCPNQFFEKVVGHYQSCVVTVVAILIRSTLGWADADTKDRRIEAGLALSAFVRPELSETSARKGLAGAIEAGFIIQTQKPTNKQPARYALRWDDPEQQARAIAKQRRAQGPTPRRGVKTEPHKWESAIVKGTTCRGADSRGPESRGPDSRGLTVAPPIYKESLKKSYSEKKEREEKKEELETKIFSPSLSQIAEQSRPEQKLALTSAEEFITSIFANTLKSVPVPEPVRVTAPAQKPDQLPARLDPNFHTPIMAAYRKSRAEMSKEWFIRQYGRPSNAEDWMARARELVAEAKEKETAG